MHDFKRALPALTTSLAALILLGCGDDPSPASAPWRAAFDPADAGALMNVWGTSAADVYSVGGQPDRGVIFHYDGTAWSEVEIPEGPMLYWIHGVDNTLVAVGEHGRVLRRDGDGVWTDGNAGLDTPLWGVWGARADRMFAVGGDARTGATTPVLLGWDGDEWAPEPMPALDRAAPALFKVWGTGPNNVFAVGSSGLMMHYDGSEWVQQSVGTTQDLISLWGRSADDILAVGGRSNGVVARYDGASWTSRTLEGVGGLNGVWMDADGAATAVGNFATAVHFDPGTWVAEPEPIDSYLVLHGVWGVSDGPRWSVGGSLFSPPPYSGLAMVSP